MTILEASGHLYQWFSKNDSFSLEKDFMNVISITETPVRDRATFLCALKDFEVNNLVSSSKIEGEKYWILNKPFSSYVQSVTITPELALTVSEIINKFCEIIDNDAETCDPSSMTEDDIKNLVYITNAMFTQKDVDSKKEEE